MSDFKLNILGCGSATPSLRHLPACQVIDYRGSLMMIDCGEGAQLSMRRQRLKFSRLNHIFISHLHGDHCLGLPGLLSTLALQDKGGTVTVHTFADGVKIFSEIMDFFCRERPFDLQFNVGRPQHGARPCSTCRDSRSRPYRCATACPALATSSAKSQNPAICAAIW